MKRPNINIMLIEYWQSRCLVNKHCCRQCRFPLCLKPNAYSFFSVWPLYSLLVYSIQRSTYFALTFNYIQFTTGIYVKYRNLHVDHLSFIYLLCSLHPCTPFNFIFKLSTYLLHIHLLARRFDHPFNITSILFTKYFKL